MHHENVLPLLLLVISGIAAFATVFIACELGQRLIDAFDEISSTIDHLKWYSLPIEIQRLLPMIVVAAQQPVSVACFGSITCTREVFKNVGIKTSTVK